MLEAHGRKPSLGWLSTLTPVALQGSVMQLKLKPGQRAMVRFLGPRQQQQLAQMLAQLTGQPMKVDLNLSTQDQGMAADGDTPGGDADENPGRSGSGGVISAAQRQAAMDLPLVRELLESFDLSLVEVRQRDTTQPTGDAASDDAPGQADDPMADDLAAMEFDETDTDFDDPTDDH